MTGNNIIFELASDERWLWPAGEAWVNLSDPPDPQVIIHVVRAQNEDPQPLTKYNWYDTYM